ncbi:unnamed protein product, partial [Rotaria sordida]
LEIFSIGLRIGKSEQLDTTMSQVNKLNHNRSKIFQYIETNCSKNLDEYPEFVIFSQYRLYEGHDISVTLESFVYRLVNKAFRAQNIDLICKYRYFIILLYNKLKKFSIEQHKVNHTIVYRGQIIGKYDLKNLRSNIGHLISINTIMSTTRNGNVARLFVISVKEGGVMFEIDIANTNIKFARNF